MPDVVVVGAGTIAQSVHLPAIQRLNDLFSLVGVVDASPIRAASVAAHHGTSAFTSMANAIAATQPDAVLICTPGDHADLTEEALHAGVHVLAEKPLALTQQQASSLGTLATQRGLVLQVGYMKMYDPALAFARTHLDQLGRILTVDVRVVHPRDERQSRHLHIGPAGGEDPALLTRAVESEEHSLLGALGTAPSEYRRWYADVLMGSVIHEFSVLRALGFAPPREYTHVDAWPWPSPGEPPSLVANALLPLVPDVEGARLTMTWAWAPDAPEYQELVRIDGTAGHILINVAPPYQLEAQSDVEVSTALGEWSQVVSRRLTPESAFVHQLEAFAAAIAGEASVASDAEGAAADIRSAQALVRRLAATHGDTISGEAVT